MAHATQEFGEWPLKRLMTEVVGSGHKSADDMDRAQAREAMARILADEPDPTTLGAFWLANRWKRNTPEELGAFVDVMREESVETAEPDADPVDCGANYDGKGRSAILGVAAGLVAAAAGTPVVVHSGDRVPTQKQDAYGHVLDELGVETDLEPTESAAMVDDVGFGFYYQPNFNPGIDALWDRRDRMGVRSFVNTVETLANPANADVHLGSFYHLPFAVKMTETLQHAESQDVSRTLFFQGMEGYDDVRPGTTVVAEWGSVRSTDESSSGKQSDPRDDAGDEELDDFEIETAEYGMDFESEDLGVDDVAADSAAVTEAVLTGDRDDQFADAVALNAALRIYAREDASDIEAEMGDAEEVLDEDESDDGDTDDLADDELFDEVIDDEDDGSEEVTEVEPATDEAESASSAEEATETDEEATADGSDPVDETSETTAASDEDATTGDDPTAESETTDAGATAGGTGTSGTRGAGAAAATNGSGGKPYLATMPEGLAGELIVVEWLEFLVGEVGVRETARAIDYYERIDWVAEPVADELQSYLRGFDGGGGEGGLTIDHHTESLQYISQLDGSAAEAVALSKLVGHRGGGSDGLQR